MLHWQLYSAYKILNLRGLHLSQRLLPDRWCCLAGGRPTSSDLFSPPSARQLWWHYPPADSLLICPLKHIHTWVLQQLTVISIIEQSVNFVLDSLFCQLNKRLTDYSKRVWCPFALLFCSKNQNSSQEICLKQRKSGTTNFHTERFLHMSAHFLCFFIYMFLRCLAPY